MDNAHIATVFDELADLLELAGENAFKTRAYRAFARAARLHAEPLAEVASRGALEEMSGVGKAIAAKVESLVGTGSFPALDRAREGVPGGLRDVLALPGVGPKAARALWKEAGVTGLEDLVRAADEGRLDGVSGLGAKKQAAAVDAARERLASSRGALLALARETARVVSELLTAEGAHHVDVAGAARRGLAIVDELVLVVTGISAARIAAALEGAPGLGAPAVAHSARDARFVAHGLPVRLIAVAPAARVHALLVATGPDAHVAALAARARNAPAPARAKDGLAAIAQDAADEEAVYRALDLRFVPPELRDREAWDVPDCLVENAHVRGVFHVHTDWSDGTATLLEMAQAAARAGFVYVGISDHSRAASYAHGLDGERLREQTAAVAIARRELQGCTILHGIEVDVLADGALDLEDDTLRALDFVIASVHTRLGMSEQEMTDRIVRAVSHPLVTILGHPTGRLLLGRKGSTFDLGAVARAAAANDTYLEINANPQRLDLSDEMVRQAAREGAKFVINPDAHATRAFADTALGVTVARRAGLAPEAILNTLDEDAIVTRLAERRARAEARLPARLR